MSFQSKVEVNYISGGVSIGRICYQRGPPHPVVTELLSMRDNSSTPVAVGAVKDELTNQFDKLPAVVCCRAVTTMQYDRRYGRSNIIISL